MATDFWGNTQRVQKVHQRISSIKDEISEYEKLKCNVDDLQILLELAIEEDENSLEPEIQNGLSTLNRSLRKLNSD